FSCASGEYLEMKNQVCSKCAEGTYSLGSGIKFDEWDELPAGFSNVATFMDTTLGSSESKADSCNNSTWTPRGNYIESNRDDCTVSLIYAVHLKKSGSVFFEYQYIDNNIFFEFFIQNDQCKEMESTADKWVKLTDNGEWGSHSVTLKSGSNILYWRTTGILMGSKVVKPVLVKNITIEGKFYLTLLSQCLPSAIFAGVPTALKWLFLAPCPLSPLKSRNRTAKLHSEERLKNYLQGGFSLVHPVLKLHGTWCELSASSFQTQIMYKWIEPKICREDLPDALTLPPSGERQDCPPCNPGFYNNASSSCTPCPPGT
ncbi:K132L protein, partial [Pheucticus melanocephalus]|nr:K132L protein [Pheucticus melanocephalus]